MTSPCAKFDAEAETIVEFLERFKVQSIDQITSAGESEIKKASVLVKALPINVITDLQRRLKPKLLSEATYEELERLLKAQYQVKKSVVGAAVKFLNRKQAAGETIENYARAINDLACECNYKDCCRDRMLRDVFVSGLYSSTVLSGVLQECESKTFNECIEKAKLLEQLTFDAQDIRPRDDNMSFRIGNSNDTAVPDSYVCIRCGKKGHHYARHCYAINLKCNKCSKKGHLARVCKSPRVSSSAHIDEAGNSCGEELSGNDSLSTNHNAPNTSIGRRQPPHSNQMVDQQEHFNCNQLDDRNVIHSRQQTTNLTSHSTPSSCNCEDFLA